MCVVVVWEDVLGIGVCVDRHFRLYVLMLVGIDGVHFVYVGQ